MVGQFEQTWRWYGPNDPVSLEDIKQAGATGVVTALHQLPIGEVWSVDEIHHRKTLIEKQGLRWSVVESVPVHEDIKRRTADFSLYINNFKQSLINLSKCGIHTVCYNFMPVLDWTRTDLKYGMNDGSLALRFEKKALLAFELFLLENEERIDAYTQQEVNEAKEYVDGLNKAQKQQLCSNIIAGLPGSQDGYSLDDFKTIFQTYQSIDREQLRSHLFSFLREVVPIAEKHEVRLCIHPDDPPYPILGLPRIMSTYEDMETLFTTIESPYNGLTFCTGSLAVHPENDLKLIIQQFGDRIHFVHLRNITTDNQGNFFESNHLEGDVDMYEMMKLLIKEQIRRKQQGRHDLQLPFRPDHGHQMLDDLKKETNPGYSAIGRLRGLAELRGLELGIRKSM